MTQAFVPLVPGALAAGAFGTTRLKPASAETRTGTANGFSPTTPKSHGSDAPTAACKTLAEPKITLERQGDVITHIRVECGCGQVVELKCEY